MKQNKDLVSKNKPTLYDQFCEIKYAVPFCKEDYDNFDYLIAVDTSIIRDIEKIIGSDQDHKIHRLMDFTSHPRDLIDPWSDGKFMGTYANIECGCATLIQHLLQNI